MNASISIISCRYSVLSLFGFPHVFVACTKIFSEIQTLGSVDPISKNLGYSIRLPHLTCCAMPCISKIAMLCCVFNFRRSSDV